MDEKFVITAAQLSDLRRFASDLINEELDSDDQAAMGHNIEAIVTTCEATPVEDDQEDEEIEQEDEDDEAE